MTVSSGMNWKGEEEESAVGSLLQAVGLLGWAAVPMNAVGWWWWGMRHDPSTPYDGAQSARWPDVGAHARHRCHLSLQPQQREQQQQQQQHSATARWVGRKRRRESG